MTSECLRNISYSVKASTEHAIFENRSVSLFVKTLAVSVAEEARLTRAGQCMYLSHDSYTRIGSGLPGN